jgi:hypothetical protein
MVFDELGIKLDNKYNPNNVSTVLCDFNASLNQWFSDGHTIGILKKHETHDLIFITICSYKFYVERDQLHRIAICYDIIDYGSYCEDIEKNIYGYKTKQTLNKHLSKLIENINNVDVINEEFITNFLQKKYR